MSIEERLAILKQVSQVAALAGLKGAIDDNGQLFRMLFTTGENRDQMVFVRHSGRTPGGQTIVTFYSPCLTVKKSLFGGFSKDQAIGLLKRNETLMFARFGLMEREDEMIVVASVDHILETLDPEEMEATAWYLATAADAYEKEHGGDDY